MPRRKIRLSRFNILQQAHPELVEDFHFIGKTRASIRHHTRFIESSIAHVHRPPICCGRLWIKRVPMRLRRRRDDQL